MSTSLFSDPFTGMTGPVYTINKTNWAALIGLADLNPTKAASVAFTVLLGEPVNSVDVSDFALIM
ncbi:MAG: hypothetical protein ACK44M_00105 [Chloroflexus sp.]